MRACQPSCLPLQFGYQAVPSTHQPTIQGEERGTHRPNHQPGRYPPPGSDPPPGSLPTWRVALHEVEQQPSPDGLRVPDLPQEEGVVPHASDAERGRGRARGHHQLVVADGEAPGSRAGWRAVVRGALVVDILTVDLEGEGGGGRGRGGDGGTEGGKERERRGERVGQETLPFLLHSGHCAQQRICA